MGTVQRLAARASFSGDALLDGSTEVEAAGRSLTIDAASIGSLGADDDPVAVLRTAREHVSETRAALGAFSKNVTGPRRRNLAVSSGILAATESAIRDTEHAAEVEALGRLSILRSAGGHEGIPRRRQRSARPVRAEESGRMGRGSCWTDAG